MKSARRCQVILFITLFTASVFAPIIFLSSRLKGLALLGNSSGEPSFVDDYDSTKHGRSAFRLTAILQEVKEEIKEPLSVVYRDNNFSSVVSHIVTNGNDKSENSTDNILMDKSMKINDDYSSIKLIDSKGIYESLEANKLKPSTLGRRGNGEKSKVVGDERVRNMKDQVVRARAYLQFAPPNAKSHLVKELKHSIREVERSLGEASKDSQLSRSSQQKMRTMEATLSKANKIYPDCYAMDAKLRAMMYNTEEQIRTQKNQVSYLINLAAQTTTRGFYCLSMQLTTEYFSRPPEQRVLPNQHKFNDPDIHHIAIFSDNILACSVVVNSTSFNSVDSGKLVFHIVTDSANSPAMWMWFVLNPPGEAGIRIVETRHHITDPSLPTLDHLRLRLPHIFPTIDKLLLLGEDVVVQKDVGPLWNCEMGEKVMGVGGNPWKFGVSMVDLKEWRRRNLDRIISMKSGCGRSEEMGRVIFENETVGLGSEWVCLELGLDPTIEAEVIEKAYAVQFKGAVKPWLDLGVRVHKRYWNRFVNYGDPFLKQCNIHE